MAKHFGPRRPVCPCSRLWTVFHPTIHRPLLRDRQLDLCSHVLTEPAAYNRPTHTGRLAHNANPFSWIRPSGCAAPPWGFSGAIASAVRARRTTNNSTRHSQATFGPCTYVTLFNGDSKKKRREARGRSSMILGENRDDRSPRISGEGGGGSLSAEAMTIQSCSTWPYVFTAALGRSVGRGGGGPCDNPKSPPHTWAASPRLTRLFARVLLLPFRPNPLPLARRRPTRSLRRPIHLVIRRTCGGGSLTWRGV